MHKITLHAPKYQMNILKEYAGIAVVVSHHRLNMGLDLQSLFGLHVHSCTHWLRTLIPPPPHLGSHTKTLLVSQDRRHLFVTPYSELIDEWDTHFAKKI